MDGAEVTCDLSEGRPRPLVPLTFRKEIFDMVHSLSHPGPRPSTKAISDRFVWPGMKRDIRAWCRACHACQVAKTARHTRAPLKTRPLPPHRFSSLHVDIADDGSLLISGRNLQQMYRLMQKAIDMAHSWAKSCGLRLSPEKTVSILFSRKHTIPKDGELPKPVSYTHLTLPTIYSV